jgi:hypothetical protein
MISASVTGSFDKTTSYLERMQSGQMFRGLDRYGSTGVSFLSNATPVDTGRAASSWGYRVTHKNGKHSIAWFNTDVEGGVNVALILQYGHGTGTGGYVVGRDYINPAMRPLFDKIVTDIWMEVTRG